jgi:AP-1 complex subunit beta-1
MQKQPTGGASGLEGLAGTPQRVASPTVGMSQPANNMDDLMGLFGNGGGEPAAPTSGADDLMNGFAGMNMGAQAASPPPQAGQKKTNEDLLSLF